MMIMIAENLAPIMFAAMIALLLLGIPVGFTLGVTGMLFFVIGVELAPLAPEVIRLEWPLIHALPSRIFGVMSNEVLLAIPFFTFMGLILERSGLAEDLLETVGQMFGTIRGGLAYAVIFVGALLAATTGVLSAAVIAMGLISLPIMLRYGYDRKPATGVIAASGTLSLIMPPSIVLIVLADQLSQPVGDMYQGAFLPALVLLGGYAIWIFLVTVFKPAALPGLPDEAQQNVEGGSGRGVWQIGALSAYSGATGYALVRSLGVTQMLDLVVLSIFAASMTAFVAASLNRLRFVKRVWLLLLALLAGAGLQYAAIQNEATFFNTILSVINAGLLYVLIAIALLKTAGVNLFSHFAERFAFVMIPPLLLIFLVLGTIFIGVATPTEAGAMGALGAVLIAGAMRKATGNVDRLSWPTLISATYATAQLSAFVMLLLIGARIFSLTFYGINGHIWIEDLLGQLPAGEIGFMTFTAALIFILAFFLDFFEIAFIVVPLLVAGATALNIDLVWFGIVIATVLQTAFLHPPFGFALIFLRSVAPQKAYIDSHTKQRIEPVTSGQIYLGALPFLAIQLVVVAIVIAFPQLVTHYQAPAVQTEGVSLENFILSAPPETQDFSGGLLINQ